MDHRYIDEHSLADRYLDRVLTPRERGDFESHLVDCQECRDRLLLAEMFHARNGFAKPKPRLIETKQLETKPEAPAAPQIRLVARFAMSRLFMIFGAAAAAAILLLLASVALVSMLLRAR